MIQYLEKERIFKIDTPSSSYCIGVYDEGYLLNLYYGKRIGDVGLDYLWKMMARNPSASFSPADPKIKDRRFSVDSAPMEYSTNGKGDFRISAIEIGNEDGNSVTDLRFDSFKIYSGREDITPLPSIRCDNNDSETLKIALVDKYTEIEVDLFYTAVKDIDCIIRSVKIINNGQQDLKIQRVFSACVDLPDMNFDFITLFGRHGFERNFEREPLFHGIQTISSQRGSSSHSHNPFAALARKGTTETTGDVYAFNFVYSGNFELSVECNHDDTSRVLLGINPQNFEWNLKPNGEFQTPEAVMVYSDEGLGKMSRTFHDLYNYHLIAPAWRCDKVKRPLLINSWEGTYFDFDSNKILSFAKKAKKLGFDMLVMDDGWFGYRNDDTTSLGDWYVNEKKLPGGVKKLSEDIHALGLKFGIWYEPEMISPDSDLYRAHPDWCVHVTGRVTSQGRHQYVLDVSREDVRDYILEQIFSVFDSCEIDYIKWDYNRNISEPGSELLSEEQGKEFFHRFILGTYDMMRRFTERYPGVLFENCSGGGGRFDPGMLYFSPQIWTSDNTDPLDRLMIQFGTSLCYPTSCMGAHVASCPRTGYETKVNVALMGTFGYELDPNKLSDSEIEIVKKSVDTYHETYDCIHSGDLYRLIDPWDNDRLAAYQYVSKDKKESVAMVVSSCKPRERVFFLKLQGLDEKKQYVDDDGNVYTGELLQNIGINYRDVGLYPGTSLFVHLKQI